MWIYAQGPRYQISMTPALWFAESVECSQTSAVKPAYKKVQLQSDLICVYVLYKFHSIFVYVNI